MPIIEHDTFYSEFEAFNKDTLIIAISGSGMVDINKARDQPLSWQAWKFRDWKYSFLTLTSKEEVFWSQSCIDEVLSLYKAEISKFKKVIMLGFSMGGWAVLEHASLFRASKVLALSPRTPQTSRVYNEAHDGVAKPIDWPLNTAVTIISDMHHPLEQKDLAILSAFGPFDHLHTPQYGHNTLRLLDPKTTGTILMRNWMKGKLTPDRFAKIIKRYI
jgi:hypothetical protein